MASRKRPNNAALNMCVVMQFLPSRLAPNAFPSCKNLADFGARCKTPGERRESRSGTQGKEGPKATRGTAGTKVTSKTPIVPVVADVPDDPFVLAPLRCCN